MCLHDDYWWLTLTEKKKKKHYSIASNLCIQPRAPNIKTILYFKVMQMATSKILCFRVWSLKHSSTFIHVLITPVANRTIRVTTPMRITTRTTIMRAFRRHMWRFTFLAEARNTVPCNVEVAVISCPIHNTIQTQCDHPCSSAYKCTSYRCPELEEHT